MATIRTVMRGIGSYLPEKRLTNDELASLVDTSDEWIVQRTGIKARHIAAEGEKTSDLATEAARRALVAAGLEASAVDLIILATSTPDNTFPATATTVQANLGITGGAAFDVQAVCTGFVYGLTIADTFLRSGSAKHALVIGAETYSRIVDWKDRTTCVLFGDGAGAAVVEATMSDGSIHDRGVLAARLRSDGRHKSKLYVDGGPSTTGQVGRLRMDGKEVFKLAVGVVPQILHDTLDDVGLPFEAIDWFVPHQANRRIIDATAEKLGIPTSKVVLTVDRHANTSAASIPLALDVAVKDGRIKQGDLVLLEAMGGGFTWGAALIRW
jgi:3-oxoacyl-[acyl-carrier-protein] synthase-3